MVALTVALALFVTGSPYDTVRLSSGSTLLGSVVEDDPAKDLVFLQAGGSLRRIPRAEVVRVTLSESRPSPTSADMATTAKTVAAAEAGTAAALRAQEDRLMRAGSDSGSADRLDTGMGTCALTLSDSDRATTEQCMSCHGGGRFGPQLHGQHQVDVDFESARMRPRSNLRAYGDVVRKGVFLPDGRVRCTTCHDRRSRFRYRLALPPDAEVSAAVDHRNEKSFDPALKTQQTERKMKASEAQLVLPVGTEVSPTPLCKVCHARD
jgi:hypothetical protein